MNPLNFPSAPVGTTSEAPVGHPAARRATESAATEQPAAAPTTTVPTAAEQPATERAAEQRRGTGRRAARRSGGRYGRLLELGGRGFLPIAFVARLPLAMITVGALTLATAVTGSYAVGGAAAGAVGIGSALGGPLMGHLADRVGQRAVLLASALAHTVAIGVLLVTAYAGTDPGGPAVPLLVAAALLVGATCPQVGPLARVRWRGLTGGDRQELDTALSYESTADELTFVLGPALVGLLASLLAPWTPFVLAAVLTLTMVSCFAVHPTHRAAPAAPRPRRRAAAAPVPGRDRVLVLLPVLGMVAMGTFFGAVQNALSAFGGEFGAQSAAGLLYAVLGISSAAAALSVAWWPQRFRPAARWVASAGAMAVLSLLFLLPGDIVPMLVVLLLVGLPVGPTMVTIYTIGGDVARPERLGTVMTMLASGVVLGTAVGAALAGLVAETAGHRGAFAAAIGAACAMVLISAALALLRRRDH
ncbi:MFS transporter [Kocuria turfanensis]|uniref:MFS transporter n=1 Tax=Kocuria turfanensis TaxID=388357 RepID=UPI0040357E15